MLRQHRWNHSRSCKWCQLVSHNSEVYWKVARMMDLYTLIFRCLLHHTHLYSLPNAVCLYQPVFNFLVHLDILHHGISQVGELMDHLQLNCTNGDRESGTLPEVQPLDCRKLCTTKFFLSGQGEYHQQNRSLGSVSLGSLYGPVTIGD